MSRPPLSCVRCGRVPADISAYVEAAGFEGITPDEYVWREEGTLNESNGHFACDDCYIAMGMPVGERGTRWTAP